MSFARSFVIASLAIVAAVPVVAQNAQVPDQAGARSTAWPRGGSIGLGLSGDYDRLQGTGVSSYELWAALRPFIGEHVQVGLLPHARGTHVESSSGSRLVQLGVEANVVVGSGRLRGYAGGYAARGMEAGAESSRTIGAQVGALYFIDPAVAVRAEAFASDQLSAAAPGGALSVVVYLEPYVDGVADAVAPAPAGFGVADVDVKLSSWRGRGASSYSASATVAPYVTRWAQVGATGTLFNFSEWGGGFARSTRAFGRLYLPLGPRTQPFAEGFMATTMYTSDDHAPDTYGGSLGVRHMLNARVALDLAAQRTFSMAETYGTGEFANRFRAPARTGLLVALRTRLGHAR